IRLLLWCGVEHIAGTAIAVGCKHSFCLREECTGCAVIWTFNACLHLAESLLCQPPFSFHFRDTLLLSKALGILPDPSLLVRMQLPVIHIHIHRGSRARSTAGRCPEGGG